MRVNIQEMRYFYTEMVLFESLYGKIFEKSSNFDAGLDVYDV